MIIIRITLLFIMLINICRTFVIIPISNRQGKDILLHVLKNKLMEKTPNNKFTNAHWSNPVFNEFRRRRHHKKPRHNFDGEEFYNLISDDLKNDDFKQWLRQEMVQNNNEHKSYEMTTSLPPVGLHKKEHISILEDEIKNAIANNNTALYNRPYIEHHGLNDFIVMRPGSTDMFVTVIPNDIYYNIEKKCVNWLDNCNLKGIRQELLTKMEST